MNKGKKLTAVVAAAATTAAMVAPAFAADATPNFTDIDGSFAKDAINKLVGQGIIHGFDATHYNPTGKITRQDFAVILAGALGLDVSSAPATPSFNDVPASNYSYKFVEALKAKGITSGVGNGAFGYGQNITRQEMAALYVRALGVDVTGKASNLSKFDDKGDIASYAQDAVGYAVEAGLFSGVDATHFAPTAPATREQVAFVAAKFIDLKASMATAKLTGATFVDNNTVTLSFDKAVDKLDASSVAVSVKATGAAVNVTGVTLSDDKKTATVKVATLAAGTTYTVKVGDNSVDFSSAATAAVSTVAASNLKQIQVVFTAPVDKTTAETVTNYNLNGANLVAGTDTASLQADGKTVIIELGTQLGQQSSNTLIVSGVNDANGNAIASATQKFSAFDFQAPTAKAVTVVGPNTLKVSFSAPIQNAQYSNFILDGGQVSVSVPSQYSQDVAGDYTVTLNVGAQLADGTHTLEVNGAVGYNTLKVNDQTLSFNFTADKTAPTVSVVKTQLYSTSSTQVWFQFNKPVAVSNGNLSNANIFAIYDGVNVPYKATSVVPTSDAKSFTSNGVTYADKFLATFGTALPTGNLNFYVDNVDATNNNAVVKDAWGNVFTTATVTGAVAVDTAKPTVASVKSTDMNTVKVTFSKQVDSTTSTTLANYTILNADGTVAAGTGLDSAGHPLVGNVTLGNDANGVADVVTLQNLGLSGGNYTMKITGVKDVAVPAANTMSDASVSFGVTDTTAPSVSKALYTQDQKTLVVYFSKAMDATSISDLNNYQIGGVTLASINANTDAVTVTPINGNTAVKVAFANKYAGLTTGATFVYGHLKDAQGNYTVGLSNLLAAGVQPDGIAGVGTDIINAKAVAADTVTFEVLQPLSGIDSSRIFFNGLPAGQASYVNQKVNSGKTDGALVTVKLNVSAASKLYTDATGFTSIQLKQDANGSALLNGNGNGLYTTATISTVADAIAPTILSEQTEDYNSNGKLDAILVTFSEKMLDSSLNVKSFNVAGYTVTDVQPVDTTNKVSASGLNQSATFKVVLTENTYNDSTNLPTVTLAQDAQDVSGNVIKAQTTGATPTKGF